MESLLFKSSLPHVLGKNDELSAKINFTFHELNIDFLKLHNHYDYWEFTILTDGTLINHLNGTSYTYKKGTLFFLTNEDCHYVKRRGSQPIKYINILVKTEYLISYFNTISPTFLQMLKNGPRHFSLPESVIIAVESIIHRANLVAQNDYETHNNMVFSAAMLIFQHLFFINIQTEDVTEEWQATLNDLLTQSDFLTFNTSDLCDALNYSSAQLTRIFRKHYNVTPHEYLIQKKFEYAKNILAYSNMKIIEIASRIGYKNLSQFNLMFKRNFGCTPGEYRRKSRS